MLSVRSILYPTDFSSYSTQAYFHAVSLAESYRASLTVVYAFTPRESAAYAVERAYWREQLETVRPSNPRIPVQHVLLEGDPATEITQFAADHGIDVIVMGTHGRTGVSHLVMGSVAEGIVRTAPVPVLTVRHTGK